LRQQAVIKLHAVLTASYKWCHQNIKTLLSDDVLN